MSKRQDRHLVRRFNQGDVDALRRIYDKYNSDLLGLAYTLLRDASLAEDVVHDVFVSFAGAAGTFQLNGSLKGYLSICAANRAKDLLRARSRRAVNLEAVTDTAAPTERPDNAVAGKERVDRLNALLGKLPWDQREAVVLHLHHGLQFRRIAQMRRISIHTIKSRYRYGLQKLRSLLLDGDER